VETATRLGRQRWVIERSFAWLTGYRQLTVRIREIGAGIDSARSCVITFKNFTDQRLELMGRNMESGGFAVPPLHFVDAQTAQVSGAKDNGFMTGAIGSLIYRIGPWRQPPGPDHIVSFRYANPFIGPNQVAAFGMAWRVLTAPQGDKPGQWDGLWAPMTEYLAYANMGVGEVEAQVIWELYPRAHQP
jgi:hypothetical protein